MTTLIERLDPEIQKPITTLLNAPAMSFDDLPAARAASRKMMQEMKKRMPPFQGVASNDRKVPGPAGAPDVKLRIYRPEQKSGRLPALLWIHGGGYMLGDLDQEDTICQQYSLSAGCVVVSVDYRLSPENPYPAPLDDCYAGLQWLASHTEDLEVDLARIAIGGASAGGGLAAGLTLMARDRAEIPVIFQLLVYPMINDCNILPPGDNLPDALFWTRKSNLFGWRSYLGREPAGDGISCYAAPYRATDLRGLPPTCITVGDLDLFALEDIDYARRLIEAGVSTELHVYPGGCHAFDMLVPGAAISQRFTADIQQALKRALHRVK